MLELIASLLVALSVAMGGSGVATADDHASPEANERAVAAIEAIIERVSAALEATQAVADEKPEITGLDRAMEVADEHAAAGFEKAAAAKGGLVDADAAPAALPEQAPLVEAPPGEVPPVPAPPVEAPPAAGPPASHPPAPAPPVDTPPVPAPPVETPGQGNRP